MGVFIFFILFTDTLSAFLLQVGFILMKIAHKSAEGTIKSGFVSWRWAFGFFMVTFASFLHVTLQAFMSIIILSATSASCIICGVLLSIFWLKEQFVW